ncbi:hypothetical protein Tco_1337957 [Tanacetum coccineum]
MGVKNRSFASVLNIRKGNPSKVIDSSPTIVLDDECLIERDFSCFLIGKFKDINALPNLYLILSNEGFENVKLTHLGGLLQPACDSFVCDERIIWISIEGLPIKAMTHNTFAKTVSSWGELTNVEDSESTTISYKRLCMKVKSNVTINDTIKLVGDEKENNSENFVNDFELDNQKELDHVSETSFKHENNMVYNQASKCSEQPLYFDDPFGFTPDLGKENVKEVNSARVSQPKEDLNGNNEGVASHFSGIKGVSYIKLGGSLLDVMDELIKVGYVLGYNMDRCIKNIKAIIGSQGDRQVSKARMVLPMEEPMTYGYNDEDLGPTEAHQLAAHCAQNDKARKPYPSEPQGEEKSDHTPDRSLKQASEAPMRHYDLVLLQRWDSSWGQPRQPSPAASTEKRGYSGVLPHPPPLRARDNTRATPTPSTTRARFRGLTTYTGKGSRLNGAE